MYINAYVFKIVDGKGLGSSLTAYNIIEIRRTYKIILLVLFELVSLYFIRTYILKKNKQNN